MPAEPRGQGGFTLIETLVAFVMLASVLAVLMQNLSQGMRNQRVSVHYLEAMQVAQSRLAEIPFVDEDMARQQMGPEDAPLRWEVDIRPHQPAEGGVSGGTTLYEVLVRVMWRERGGTSELQLQTLRVGDAPDG